MGRVRLLSNPAPAMLLNSLRPANSDHGESADDGWGAEGKGPGRRRSRWRAELVAVPMFPACVDAGRSESSG